MNLGLQHSVNNEVEKKEKTWSMDTQNFNSGTLQEKILHPGIFRGTPPTVFVDLIK